MSNSIIRFFGAFLLGALVDVGGTNYGWSTSKIIVVSVLGGFFWSFLVYFSLERTS